MHLLSLLALLLQTLLELTILLLQFLVGLAPSVGLLAHKFLQVAEFGLQVQYLDLLALEGFVVVLHHTLVLLGVVLELLEHHFEHALHALVANIGQALAVDVELGHERGQLEFDLEHDLVVAGVEVLGVSGAQGLRVGAHHHPALLVAGQALGPGELLLGDAPLLPAPEGFYVRPDSDGQHAQFHTLAVW